MDELVDYHELGDDEPHLAIAKTSPLKAPAPRPRLLAVNRALAAARDPIKPPAGPTEDPNAPRSEGWSTVGKGGKCAAPARPRA